MICLDTNAVIAFLNNPSSSVGRRMREVHNNGMPSHVSVIVLFELWYGAAKSGASQRNMERLADFFAGPVQVLTFDVEDSREAGEIRAVLAKAGTPIGPYDVLIAAQARRRGATLVTDNEKEFLRVPGLRVENWLRV